MSKNYFVGSPEERVHCNKVQCKTCPFLPENYNSLTHLKWAEILTYLSGGTNHLCHSTNNATVCRGGRNWQLEIFHRRGFIAAPTDEALQAAVEQSLLPRN